MSRLLGKLSFSASRKEKSGAAIDGTAEFEQSVRLISYRGNHWVVGDDFRGDPSNEGSWLRGEYFYEDPIKPLCTVDLPDEDTMATVRIEVWSFGFGNSTNSFLILQTKDSGASLETTILIYAAFNLVAALISYPAGCLSDKWGRKNILLASFIIFLIAYLGFAVTQNILVIAGLFVFYGLYEGIFRTVGKAFASDFVPEQLRASGVGWYSTTVGLGLAVP